MTATEYKTRLDALNPPESCPDSLIAKIDEVVAEATSRAERALRIGRIEFASAGATRKRP